MAKNLPCSARNVGSIPGPGTEKTHVVRRLSSWAAAVEPVCSGVHVPQLKSPCTTTTEAGVLWSPVAATKESLHHSKISRMMQLRPSAAKKKNKTLTHTSENLHHTLGPLLEAVILAVPCVCFQQ